MSSHVLTKENDPMDLFRAAISLSTYNYIYHKLVNEGRCRQPYEMSQYFE